MNGLPANLSSHQEFFLNSLHFFFFSCIAICLLRNLYKFRTVRNGILFVLNVYFLYFFVGDVFSAIFLFGMLLITYGIGEIRVRCAKDAPYWIPLILSVFGWGFLFFVKNPNFLSSINVFYYYPVRLIGISYIVFRCLHYMLDVEYFAKRNFLTFINYCIFFPTLLAGPIERFEKFRTDHDGDTIVKDESILPILHRIANGFIKKFVIADNLVTFCILSKGNSDWTISMIWVGVLLQMVCLYLDFSGYCDIVIGIARLMRFKICENFNKPWLARNVQEFWDRWHMSLSSFVRDYCFTPIYITIARNAKYDNRFFLMIPVYFFTMLLIALWHATTWGFFIFGTLHGISLISSVCLKRFLYLRLPKSTIVMFKENFAWNSLRQIITFVFISITMISWYFGPEKGLAILIQMFGGRG